MKREQQGRLEACGAKKTNRRHPEGCTRSVLLRGCMRVGVLLGIAGLSAVLSSREENFECSSQCGKCPKLTGGKCGLGLK